LNSYNDDRIKLIQNDNNGKYVINRNIGIKSSKGDFIAFCDDDDLWHPKNLKFKINYFIDDQSIGMITSKEEIINELGEKTGKTTHEWVNSNHLVTFKNLFFRNVGSPSAAIIKRNCFNEIGYFDESDNSKNIEDIDYWLRLSLKFKIFYLNEVLGYFRVHDKNQSYINDTQILNSFFLRKKLFKEKNKELSSFHIRAKFHIKKIKIKIAFFYFKQKKIIESLKWLGKLFKD
jgi:glycosyltransferase involved in cell wall biosynthesis